MERLLFPEGCGTHKQHYIVTRSVVTSILCEPTYTTWTWTYTQDSGVGSDQGKMTPGISIALGWIRNLMPAQTTAQEGQPHVASTMWQRCVHPH